MRLAPWFRVACLFCVAGSLASALVLHGARAHFDGVMMSLGSRVMAFRGVPPLAARALRVNGVDLLLRTEVVDAPLDLVLRHYHSVCATPRRDSGEYGPLIASLATRSGSNSTEGYVACIETGAADLETLTERLVEFSRTWDLADLGSLRYAYATRAADRPEQRTFLMTMWTDGSLDLRAFLPIAGSDARGTDPSDVPRPPRSQRILSATEMMAPSSVHTYLASDALAAQLAAFYRKTLSESGWDILERSPDESLQVDGVRILSAGKGGRLLTVLAHEEVSSGTVVTLLVSEVD